MTAPSIPLLRSMSKAFTLLALVLASPDVFARSLHLEVQRLAAPGLVATPLSLTLDEQTLHLTIARAEADAIGYDGPIDWQCQLTVIDQGHRGCAGPLTGGVGDNVQLSASIDANAAAFTLSRDDASLHFDLPLAAGAAINADLKRAPLAWLEPTVRRYLPQARLRGGMIDARVVAKWGDAFDIEFKGDRLDAATGSTFAFDGVNIAGKLHWDASTDLPQFTMQADIDSGAIEAPATRISLPAKPSPLMIEAQQFADGAWSIDQLNWVDKDVLEFNASGEIDTNAAVPLRQIHVEISDLDLVNVRTRYAQRLIETTALADIATIGHVSAEVEIGNGELTRVDAKTNGVQIEMPASDLKIDGLAGRFAWAPKGTTPAADLRWRSISYGKLQAGPLAMRLRTIDGAIELVKPVDLTLAGGDVQIRALRFDPNAALDNDTLTTDLSVHNLGYDNATGTVAAAGVSADIQASVADPFGLPRIAAIAKLTGGEVLYDSVYVKFPETPIDLAVQVAANGQDQWSVTQLDWSDGGVLDFRANARLDLSAEKWLPELHLRLSEITLAKAAERYGKTWLAANGCEGLHLAGKLAGELDFNAEGVQRFALYADRISVADDAGRFAIDTLNGAVDWTHGSARPPTSIAWKKLEFYRNPFGPATLPLTSAKGAIELTQKIPIDVLGGKINLEKLKLEPQSDRGERYGAAIGIAGIEMSQLSELLGWPRFPGNLSGGIPSITLVGDTIELDGGLNLYVFDGKIDISGVTLERPFGVAPSLGAGIYIRGLDLAPLTSAFEIAAVSGRLDGDIKTLRMVDWSPVSFDAWLRTRGGGRMSYKVVQDVTSIGGGLGSITESLQNLAMKVVDTFGYKQFGIRCRLVDTVCKMGGIDAAAQDDSYTIVEGSGLPRISIVGHRRRVDWPTFVDRVLEAITGKGPVVE